MSRPNCDAVERLDLGSVGLELRTNGGLHVRRACRTSSILITSGYELGMLGSDISLPHLCLRLAMVLFAAPQARDLGCRGDCPGTWTARLALNRVAMQH